MDEPNAICSYCDNPATWHIPFSDDYFCDACKRSRAWRHFGMQHDEADIEPYQGFTQDDEIDEANADFMRENDMPTTYRSQPKEDGDDEHNTE
jgi:hypothetical protein